MSVALQNGLANGLANGPTNGTNVKDLQHILDDVEVPFIPLAYEASDASALKLIATLRPEWSGPGNKVQLIRFTDGITNTLLKAVNCREGVSKEDLDRDAVLLRAYGHGTDVLIDRHRETQNHELLMKYGLAPELLARFKNGMLYRFIRGAVTHPNDLRRPAVLKAVARRLAQWHARVPCIPETPHTAANGHANGHANGNSHTNGCTADAANGDDKANETEEEARLVAIDSVAPGKPVPSIWTTMQKWIFALPTGTETQRTRQANLQKELERLVGDLSQRPGLGKDGLVFAHCDLLSGNIIVLPKPGNGATTPDPATEDDIVVSFIDYEYAVPSPAAFDIANHFAEWGGFDCDMSVLPTRSQRLDFVKEYIYAYNDLIGACGEKEWLEREVEGMMGEVDVFRGVPGFYWGVWALIQAEISEIEFDYAGYAELRLGEYWDWREEEDGTRVGKGGQMGVREARWAQA